MNNILEVEHVSKAYSNHVALDDVSLVVPEGCIYGLLGPNGAGKTTLIRIINHITAPDSGRVLLGGEVLTQQHVEQIGYLPEERGLYKKMTVGEQAVFFARLKGLTRADAVKALRERFEKFDIMPWWNKKVEQLSKGMAQKVQFIITVLHQPKVLIFDEPFSGFDPINANLLKDEILELKRNGSTVILSTHNMNSVEEMCDHITLINKSRNILSGEVDELRRRFSEGRYVVTCDSASAEQLVGALGAVADEVAGGLTERGDGYMLNLHLRPEATVRQLLSIANDNAEVQSFGPAMTSMNDIFISAVGADKPL